MSLLLDALDRAERARREQRSLASPELTLEPREGAGVSVPAGPGGDGTALFDLDSRPPSRRWLLVVLIGVLLAGIAGTAWLYRSLATPASGALAMVPPPRAALHPAEAVAPPSSHPALTPPGAAIAGGNISATSAPARPAPPEVPRPPANRSATVPDRVASAAPAGPAGGMARAQAVSRAAGSASIQPPVRDVAAVDVEVFRRPARRTPPDAALMEAWSALRDGRLEAAGEAYRRLEAEQPGNPDVQLGLGRLAAEQGQVEAARHHYQRALELDPRNAAASAALAVLAPRGSDDSGESRLRSAAAGSDGDARFALAVRLSAAGQWPEAEQAWFEALRDRPDDPDLLYNLAVALDHLNQASAARQYYQAALQAGAGKMPRFDRAQVEQRLRALGG